MKKTYYKQCKITKGNSHQMAWIPELYAIQNQIIKLKVNDEWVNGYTVSEVYSPRVEESNILDSHAGIKNHRKRTGDSLKK